MREKNNEAFVKQVVQTQLSHICLSPKLSRRSVGAVELPCCNLLWNFLYEELSQLFIFSSEIVLYL